MPPRSEIWNHSVATRIGCSVYCFDFSSKAFAVAQSNRERDALAQLLVLARRRIETRAAYVRIASLALN